MTSVLADREAYVDGLAEFVAVSPTSFHAAHAAATLLRDAGFEQFDETQAWQAIGARSRGFVIRDGAIIAWRAGAEVAQDSPVRVLGCHTDSPGLVLKPQPDFSAHGWQQVGVEIYGGPLLTTWFDRDLALAGRVVTRAGEEHLVQTGAIARVPMLAIHLDREIGNGFAPDRQRHMQPVIGVGERDSVLGLLAEQAGIREEDLAGADIRLVDVQPPARLGTQRELFASPRLDNLTSVYAGLIALVEGEVTAGEIAMLAAFDHEELGSESRSGASGPFLADVLGRLRAGLGSGLGSGLGVTAENGARALAASWCLSSDAGHSVHPNHAEKHDPNVQPLAGSGPMLKVNSNQRYATDAHGAALWRRCCEAAGVPSQVFVSNNAIPCGSTIGPLTATRLGMRTVDVGVPLLSMHSVRELAHVSDLHALARVVDAFFAGA